MSFKFFRPQPWKKLYLKLDGRALAEHDAKKLHDAMKGLGTDEANVIRILASRTPQQIALIRQVFDEKYQKGDLIKWIKDDFSGDIEDLLVALAMDPAEKDAMDLRQAMKGLGTDDDALVQLLITKSPNHLRRVAEIFDKKYGDGKTLVQWVEDDTSGNYRMSLIALLDPDLFYAERINSAIKGAGTDDQQLIRLLVGLKNTTQAQAALREFHDPLGIAANLAVDMDFELSAPSLQSVSHKYQMKYGQTLVDAIKGDLSGNYQNLALALCTDPAERDAIFIHEACAQLGTNEEKIVEVLVARTPRERLAIGEAYLRLYGKTLIDEFKSETSFNFEKVLVGLVKPRAEQDADALNEAMKGLGTDDEMMIRILTHRSYKDLREICEIYEKKYGKPLIKAIRGDTSGWYKRALCYILRQAYAKDGPDVEVPVSMMFYKKDVNNWSSDY